MTAEARLAAGLLAGGVAILSAAHAVWGFGAWLLPASWFATLDSGGGLRVGAASTVVATAAVIVCASELRPLSRRETPRPGQGPPST
ncbi:MAG: hypothetical protein ACKVWR_03445 [Acidimicrobiales bacterium]